MRKCAGKKKKTYDSAKGGFPCGFDICCLDCIMIEREKDTDVRMSMKHLLEKGIS